MKTSSASRGQEGAETWPVLKRQRGPKVPLVAVEQLEVIPKTWRGGGSLKTTWFQLEFSHCSWQFIPNGSAQPRWDFVCARRKKTTAMTELKMCDRGVNAQRCSVATVSEVLMGLWRVYDPTWRVKEGHLLPVSDPERVCFGCPKSAALTLL